MGEEGYGGGRSPPLGRQIGCTGMTGSKDPRRRRASVLHNFNVALSVSTAAPEVARTEEAFGLAVPVSSDMENKRQAMERIGARPFVSDARRPEFAAAQRWIEDCSRQVRLPLNFCGGLLILRIYRLITPAERQTPRWMAAVQEAAASYDFAFLALGHADDEADNTLSRDGQPTRFVTHPDTRAVDGINLLLAGVTAMQEILETWPRDVSRGALVGRHKLAPQINAALTRALREASFPILMDRAGLGHARDPDTSHSSLAPIIVDAQSLSRLEAYARHRAHTYFMRATDLAVLLAGYTRVEASLADALDRLFGLWGVLGAATDDLQDMHLDFSAGIHSVCTVMAHLCVAEDADLRPSFRRGLPQPLVGEQRNRLMQLLTMGAKLDRVDLLAFLDEIELRRALTEHLEGYGADFAAAIYKAVVRFGFSAELMMEIVSVVARDPDFRAPDMYLSALRSVTDEAVLSIMNIQVGKFIAGYVVERFWPQQVGPE